MAGAIIRYAGKRALSYTMPMRTYKRARTAYYVGRAAYHNRHRIGRAAKTIYRAYRSYRARTRRVGERVGTGMTKRSLIASSTASQLVATQQLQLIDLTAIPRTTTNETSERQRDAVNLRGFKICMEISNTTVTPAYVNIAVISPKQNTDGDPLQRNMFRAMGENNTRGADFDALPSDMDRHCRPLNKDKFVILKHWRFSLDATGNTDPFRQQTRAYTMFQKYVKLGRQVRYEGTGTDSENGGCVLIYWFGQFNGTAPEANKMRVRREIVTYWKEPKN